MTKDADFKLLEIKTIILKVNIDCDGCRLKVKKLLQRIEGVYTVSIDAECQKVTVSGNVDSATLIKKLARSGKHAELWSKKSSTQVNNKDQRKQNIMQSLKAFKNHDNFSSDEDEDCEDDDALRFLESKMKNQLTNGKKNGHIGGLHQPQQQQQQQQGRNQAAMMMNLQGNQNYSSSLMNLRDHNSNVMMPQIVYNKATQMPLLTGYYYNGSSDYETHLFSDENTNGCVVM
ncbi:hypothetical protein J5N97_027864 [Dioscorea zingiberensis]|uniref:HMA domain-containing protein n=1 Tax=Dioscorea zingiberensis TaxID=325984 RepID=A0A9D5BYB8_9LILI|nr:hypothetical protein J5N97_027864 [Dioscorea zingiberensis]